MMIKAQYQINLQIVFRSSNSKMNQSSFYISQLTKLMKEITPFKYDQCIIFTSSNDLDYRKYIEVITQEKPKVNHLEPSVPILHKLSPTQIILDGQKNILRNPQNSKQSVFNLLYIFGSIKQVKIILPVMYNEGLAFQKQIIDTMKRFSETFGNKFLPPSYSQQRKRIKQSVTLLICKCDPQEDIYLVLKGMLEEEGFIDGDESEMIEQILKEIMTKRKIITREGIEDFQISRKKLRGAKLSEKAKETILNEHLKEIDSKTGKPNSDRFQDNIAFLTKKCSSIVKFIQDNIKQFFDIDQRKGKLQQFSSLFMNGKISGTMKNKSKLAIPVYSHQNFALMIMDSLQLIHQLNPKTEEEQENLLYRLLKEFSRKQIINESQYLESSEAYGFSIFLQTALRIFSIQSVTVQFQLIHTQALNSFKTMFQELLDKLYWTFEGLQNIQNTKLFVNKFMKFLNFLDGIQQTSAVLDAKQPLNEEFIKFYFSYYLSQINGKMLRGHQIFKNSLHFYKCVKKGKSDQSKMLQKIYEALGNQLKRVGELQLSLQCYKQAKSYLKFNEIFQHCLRQKYKHKMKLEDVVEFYTEMGFIEEARKICYYYMQEDESNCVQIGQIMFKFKDQESLNKHFKFVQKLDSQKLKFLDEKLFIKIQEVYDMYYGS